MSDELNVKRPCILVVEDEPMILLMSMDLVEDAGFEAIAARNADEAIKLLEDRGDIRLVFTDIDMPSGSMNGLRLAEAVRGRWPPIELILISGHLHIDELDLPKRSRFFTKPYDAYNIAKTMRAMVA